MRNKILKYIFFFFITVGLAYISSSCSQEEATMEKKIVSLRFSFDENTTPVVNANAETKEVGAPAKIKLKLEDNSGLVVYNDYVILAKVGEDYISDDIQVPVGSYLITEYLVADADNMVIYVTPVEGSSMAHLVTDPLPIEFTAAEGITTTVKPEVIDANMGEPADYGYISFGFEVVPAVY